MPTDSFTTVRISRETHRRLCLLAAREQFAQGRAVSMREVLEGLVARALPEGAEPPTPAPAP